MTILNNFNMDELRKARARKAAGTGVDLEAALNEIAPDISKLKVGQTAKLPIPSGTALRQFVMSITAKLNNLTPKGGAWEGRTYKTASDGEGHLYVQRGPDDKNPVERKRGNGGGRRKASQPAAQGETETVRA